MPRSTAIAVALLAFCGRAGADTAPTVTAKGADISLTAGDGGDVVLVSDAGSVTADGLIASAAETATALEARLADVALLSADVAKVQQDVIGNNDAMGLRVGAIERRQKELIAQLESVALSLASVSKSVTAWKPTSCPAKEVTEAAAASKLTVDWAGDHGDTVPVGVVARFACNDGLSAADTTALLESTCRIDGWTKTPSTDACTACTIADCARCGANGVCTMCRGGSKPVVAKPAALELKPSQVTLELTMLRQKAGFGSPERMKQCAVNGKHGGVAGTTDPSWKNCPSWSLSEGITCGPTAKLPYITVDLLKEMLLDTVTAFFLYGGAPRSYCGVKLLASTSGKFAGEETALYDTPKYGTRSTEKGLVIAGRATRARYVRLYVGGNKDVRETFGAAHVTEIDVTAADPDDVSC